MALIDTATLVPNSGNYFIAPVGTAAPTDLSAIPATWVNIGHTSLEDIMSFESEGGEQSVLGTLQNPSLRTSYSKRSETWSNILQQWDEDSLRLYFGSNATDDGALWLHVPNTPAPTQTAFLAVFNDGPRSFAIHATKAEVLRGDDLEFADTESFAGLPLQITPLGSGAGSSPYSVTPIGGITAP